MPIAEASGQALALNDWVLQQALAQLKRWKDEGLTPVPVVVSLCAEKFRLDNMSTRICRSLETWNVEPRHLLLEIPETVAMEDPSATALKFEQLRELGVSIIIEGFGDCYTSLQQIRALQPGMVKIAQSLTSGSTSGESHEIILGSLIDVAHRLQLQTMAEGVDSPEQLALIERIGCRYAQGSQLTPPLTPDNISELLIKALAPQP